MAHFSRTWWGKRFIEALESFTDAGRLSRGRSYANGGKVRSFEINDGRVTAKVRGSVNPYFGVYTEPLYTTEIELKPISATKWSKAIALLSSRASYVSKLLMNEIPDNIEAVLNPLNVHLLPYSSQDFQTTCSCPDWNNPCKHIAGVCYLLAAELDQDPFLLFELRGLSRQDLLGELGKSPLGQILSSQLTSDTSEPQPSDTYYTQPQIVAIDALPSLKDFWMGQKRLPQTIEVPTPAGVSAIVIKKQGDFPPFWDRDASFIEVMEAIYERVKAKNRDLI